MRESATINLFVNEMSMISDALERMEKSNNSGWDKSSIREVKCSMIRQSAIALGRGQELLKDKKYNKECFGPRRFKKDYPKGTKFY